MKKITLLIAYWLFSLYPPVELTRYILVYEKNYGREWQFQFEIYFIWVCYILAQVLVGLVIWTKVEDNKIKPPTLGGRNE